MSLDYPRYEVIVLDDRSEDGTGVLLDELKHSHPALQVVHIEALPAGWLGKNHALHVGATSARGSWILFTDADVELRPDVLKAAVGHATSHGLDHLTALPHLISLGFLLRSFVAAFGQFFSFATLRASAPCTGGYVGISAFNLIKSDVYQRLGGYNRRRSNL